MAPPVFQEAVVLLQLSLEISIRFLDFYGATVICFSGYFALHFMYLYIFQMN